LSRVRLCSRFQEISFFDILVSADLRTRHHNYAHNVFWLEWRVGSVKVIIMLHACQNVKQFSILHTQVSTLHEDYKNILRVKDEKKHDLPYKCKP
jgi:hypothetical protein